MSEAREVVGTVSTSCSRLSPQTHSVLFNLGVEKS